MNLIINRREKILTLPKAIIFDTDNTLYPYEPAHRIALKAVINKASQMLGVKANIFEHAIKEAKSEIKKRLGAVASSHSRLLYFQRALEILGLRTQLLITLDLEQTYWSTFLRTAKLFPYAKELLFYIKKIGIKTSIITDLTAKIQFRKIIYFGLDELFDYVVTSEESGNDKPSKDSFELSLIKLGVKASECWMIGDSINADILGAQNQKIVSFQKVHDHVEHYDRDTKADAIFYDYESLFIFIKNLNEKKI